MQNAIFVSQWDFNVKVRQRLLFIPECTIANIWDNIKMSMVIKSQTKAYLPYKNLIDVLEYFSENFKGTFWYYFYLEIL